MDMDYVRGDSNIFRVHTEILSSLKKSENRVKFYTICPYCGKKVTLIAPLKV